MKARLVVAGRQRGHVLLFLKSKVVRHEIVGALSVALVPADARPDFFVRRGLTLSNEELLELRTDFITAKNPTMLYRDGSGATFFALPVAVVRTAKA